MFSKQKTHQAPVTNHKGLSTLPCPIAHTTSHPLLFKLLQEDGPQDSQCVPYKTKICLLFSLPTFSSENHSSDLKNLVKTIKYTMIFQNILFSISLKTMNKSQKPFSSFSYIGFLAFSRPLFFPSLKETPLPTKLLLHQVLPQLQPVGLRR